MQTFHSLQVTFNIWYYCLYCTFTKLQDSTNCEPLHHSVSLAASLLSVFEISKKNMKCSRVETKLVILLIWRLQNSYAIYSIHGSLKVEQSRLAPVIRVCLFDWFLPVYLLVFPVPPIMICLLLSVHPFLIYYEYHNICPWGALPRNYTPFTLTRTCWSIHHTYQNASSTYDSIRRLWGGRRGAHPECTHTVNAYHTQDAKNLHVSYVVSLSRAHTRTQRNNIYT